MADRVQRGTASARGREDPARRTMVVAALAAALLGASLAACATDSTGSPDGAASPSPAGVPPASAASTADNTGGPTTTSRVALLNDVGVESREDSDRIVFAFRDAGTPGWVVRYTDPPIIEEPTGEVVDVDGSALLSIRLEPASGSDLSGEGSNPTYTGPGRLPGEGGPVIEVAEVGDFEGVLTWVAGLDGYRTFSVSALTDPARLVVDIEAG